MTLDKHEIQGLPKIPYKVLPIIVFERMLLNAGYYKTATVNTHNNRIKVWFNHSIYPRVECIYSIGSNKCITAYHKD